MPKANAKSRSVEEFLKTHDAEETIKSSLRFRQWVKRKKEGNIIGILSLNQKRILKLLSKTTKGYTRTEIVQKSGIHQSNVSLSVKTGVRQDNKVKGKKSLLDLKLVKEQLVTIKGEEVVKLVLTQKGLQTAAKFDLS